MQVLYMVYKYSFSMKKTFFFIAIPLEMWGCSSQQRLPNGQSIWQLKNSDQRLTAYACRTIWLSKLYVYCFSKKLDETTAELKKMAIELENEKAKTDRLLHEMLPKKVADQLKQGKTVEAGMCAIHCAIILLL